jgi:hypothetical protein
MECQGDFEAECGEGVEKGLEVDRVGAESGSARAGEASRMRRTKVEASDGFL